MLKDLFQTKKKYATIKLHKKDESTEPVKPKEVQRSAQNYDDKIWMKCSCGEIILIKDYEENFRVCPSCKVHGRMDAKSRLSMIVDAGSFVEYDEELRACNPLDFPEYEDKIRKAKEQTGLGEAVITGEGKIAGNPCGLAFMDPNFMMGSMGSAVGEKITRMIEKSIERRNPVVIFSASGGARMQEGILSLMQMAKTSAALGKLDDEGLLYISVLTDPTTGGVTASFAMLGDIILAEPKALIAFAGPRVIEQTIKQKLPEGFQKAEFLLEKGFVDKIVERAELKKTIAEILNMHLIGGEFNEQ